MSTTVGTTYFHRHIKVEASMLHGEKLTLSRSVDLKDDDSVEANAGCLLENVASMYKECIWRLALPSNPKPGDEWIVNLEIEYSAVFETGETSSFTIDWLETIYPRESEVAVDNAAHNLFKAFTRKARCFIQD